MPKTVCINGTFEVKNAAATCEAKKVIKSEAQHEEATQHFPFKLDGGSGESQISMGGVTQSRSLYLKVDQKVTLKLNQQTDTGFTFGPGVLILESEDGITEVWVTVGANDTYLEAIFAGD